MVLLRSSPVFPALIEWAKRSKLATTVITSPDQAPELKRMEVEAHIVDHFDNAAAKLLPPLTDSWVAISFGARWIFRSEILYGTHAFAGRLVNAHGTRLPFDRGGGGFSWRVMRGDRIGCLLLHKVDAGIDTGSVVAFEDYVIPRALQTPAEIAADYERRQLPFVIEYLERGALLDGVAQPDYAGTYYPRLRTPTHAWIDWSWPAQEIERFILAFDEPYPGARTCWRNAVLILKQTQLHRGEVPHHPFQSGLVIRNNRRWLTVALPGPDSLIIESVTDEKGESLMSRIAEGDRFFTPPERLSTAMQERVTIGPKGAR